MINRGKRNLSIAVYPFKTKMEDNKKYIDLAKKYGFTRMYTHTLALDEKIKDKQMGQIRELCHYASSQGFEVVMDIDPNILQILGVEPTDLSYFHDLKINTLRLDVPFNGPIEREMTHNKYGIHIELNASSFANYLDYILEMQPIKDRISASHNFYPQKYSAMDYDNFIEKAKHYKERGIRMTAYVTSDAANQGPWDVMEGSYSIEMHRGMPITTQIKHLWATGVIDDILIGNMFASEEEFKAISKIDPYKLELEVELDKGATKVEKEILFDHDFHFRRGDITPYTIRSTMTRVKHKDDKIPQRINNKNKQSFGEIYIPNDKYAHYKGEAHLILKDMEKEERKNYVGKVVKHEEFLIDYIGPWSVYGFVEKK